MAVTIKSDQITKLGFGMIEEKQKRGWCFLEEAGVSQGGEELG